MQLPLSTLRTENMKSPKIIIAFFVAVSGCASVAFQSLQPNEVRSLRSGKTAVVVFDNEKKITYDNTTFYGVGIALSNATATYDGFFDLEQYAGSQLSKRFNERGLKSTAQQLPTSLWTSDLVAKYADVKGTMVGQTKNLEIKQNLPKAWKDFLVSNGYDYLILSVIPGLGVSASNFDRKQVLVGFWTTTYLYDVKKDTLAWSTTIGSGVPAEIQSSPKDLETNNFSTLRVALNKGFDFVFEADRGAWKGFDIGMGLKPKL